MNLHFHKKMEQLYTRRGFIKNSLFFLAGSLLFTSAGYTYARLIEPKRLITNKHTIHHPLIPKKFNGIRIVQFSDTHLGHYFDLNRLAKVVEKINELQPDIVLFTGDLIHEPNKFPDAGQIIPILSKIEAPLGKFSIYGNHDHGGYGTDIFRDLMKRSGFTVLVNEHTLIELDNNNKIAIAGLDDMLLGKPDFSAMTNNIPPETYTIALVHEPDGANMTAFYPVHLQLSGHSHGGQIQLPFFGPLITPPLGNQYYEGFYKVGNLTLYVNRGIGTTRIPFRFLSAPELAVFTLTNQGTTNHL